MVATLRDFFGDAPGGPYMVFSPWPLADLAPHGFAPIGHPPLMLRPAGGTAPLVHGFHIERATDVDTLADFERTLIEAYPITEMQPWERGAYLRERVFFSNWRFFVGYEGDTAVATAAAYVTPTVTIVELVSARPECRGKGYGAAITAAATLTEPDRPAMLVASDLGRNVYARGSATRRCSATRSGSACAEHVRIPPQPFHRREFRCSWAATASTATPTGSSRATTS